MFTEKDIAAMRWLADKKELQEQRQSQASDQGPQRTQLEDSLDRAKQNVGTQVRYWEAIWKLTHHVKSPRYPEAQIK